MRPRSPGAPRARCSRTSPRPLARYSAFWVSMRVMPASDIDLDDGEPVEREGRETLLPSVTRSVLSTKSFVAESLNTPAHGSQVALGDYDADGGGDMFEVPDATDDPVTIVGRQRGARSGDMVGGRYVVEGQVGRGGMGRVLKVRHSALGKPFALKLIKSAIATNP